MSRGRTIFLGIIVALVVVAGGYLALVRPWEGVPAKPDINTGENAPRLFTKDDYQIEEVGGEKYIVVEKVGLRAKVPTGWTIKFEGDDFPEPEYWVNLSSPDVQITNSVLIKGCNIAITAGTERKNNQDIKRDVLFIKENPEQSQSIRQDYQFSVVKIGDSEVLKWSSPANEIIGQFLGIDIAKEKDLVLTMNIVFPLKDALLCQSNWEDFIMNIELE